MNQDSAGSNAGSSVPVSMRGIIAPIITPLRTGTELDIPGLEKLLRHLLDGGVNAILVLGSTGEAPSLPYALRREVVTRACQFLGSRVSVLVGLIDTSAIEIRNLAEHAANAGAHALLVTAPYYFPLSQTELLRYIERLVPQLPLPVLLYNIPQMTKVPFELRTLAALIENTRIVGIKDSSGEMPYVERALQLKAVRPDWTVLVGSDHLLLEGMRRGADGGVTGGAVFHPRLFVKLFDEARQLDTVKTHELQEEVLNICRLYSVNTNPSGVVRAIKCACNLLELCSDLPAEPFEPFTPPEREMVRSVLRSGGLLA